MVDEDFKADVFLTDLEVDRLHDALVYHKSQTFKDVFNITFPALYKITSKQDLEKYEPYFIENFGVHECDGCADWIDEDDLEEGYCTDCVKIKYEDED